MVRGVGIKGLGSSGAWQWCRDGKGQVGWDGRGHGSDGMQTGLRCRGHDIMREKRLKKGVMATQRSGGRGMATRETTAGGGEGGSGGIGGTDICLHAHTHRHMHLHTRTRRETHKARDRHRPQRDTDTQTQRCRDHHAHCVSIVSDMAKHKKFTSECQEAGRSFRWGSGL